MLRKSLPSSSNKPSLEDNLELANEYMDNVSNASTLGKALILCGDAKAKLKDAEAIVGKKRGRSHTLNEDLANAYYKHHKLTKELGEEEIAQKSYEKAGKWGYDYEANQWSGPSQPAVAINSTIRSLNPPSPPALSAASNINASASHGKLSVNNVQPIQQGFTQKFTSGSTICEIPVTSGGIEMIFELNVAPPVSKFSLPKAGERITSTSQLAYCLSLLNSTLESKEGLDKAESDWSKVNENDSDEKERLQIMATNVIRAFVRDELKSQDVVSETVSLTAVLKQDESRELLKVFVNGIGSSDLLEVHLLEGLAHLIRNTPMEGLEADDLVKTLELLSARLRGTHQQSTRYTYRLAQTVSHVLDSMVDCEVKEISRQQLHEPLSQYLKDLRESSDPCLVYQAAYTYQALQHIPDDETTYQACVRRTGKVVKGISDIVSAMKAVDLDRFTKGVHEIQEGLMSAGEAIVMVNDAYKNAMALAESGQGFFQSLKESLSFSRKRIWYPALRVLDALLLEGRLPEFEKLIRTASCRFELAFQWGACQRLGELAANPLWDIDTRQGAVSLLGELYKDDVKWGRQINVKQWILHILNRLAESPESAVAGHVKTQLKDLETVGDSNKRSFYRACVEEAPGPYILEFTLSSLRGSRLVDYVQNKPDVESSLRQLKRERLRERGGDVYISPRAKLHAGAKEDFDLTLKVHEFLESDKKVFLLRGDSGAGKSTFNRALETDLWGKYDKVGGRIPLFIHLPAIKDPDVDLIEKQLRKVNFTEDQIRELKLHRDLILICDGYDESQQTRNLYTSNQLNQAGGWQAQMVISCRTEYTGVDYRDQFQPTDRNSGSGLGLMDELIIAPFNKDQIQDYIDQYVSAVKPSWESKDYVQALKEIPNLQDLVRNPFLLKMALEVLPTMAKTGGNFSTIRITRVVLYDKFVTQWLERSKIRFGEMNLSALDQDAFRRLSRSGFKVHGIKYIKELATAIYDNQEGNPVVKYSEYSEGSTWKAIFFDHINGNNLLQEAIPLVRNGDHFRFVHKSMLEYGLTLAVFDPSIHEESMKPIRTPSHQWSHSSKISFESTTRKEEAMNAISRELLESPLGRRNLVSEPSILQFLVDRVRQHTAFKDQLHCMIELSKTNESASTAAVNSITVLVQAGVQFIGADLRGIRVPGANLSYGMFDSAQLGGSDLRNTNLRNVWLRQANLSGAQMGGVQFGELPYLQEYDTVRICAYSPNGETFAVGLRNGDISLYDTADWSWKQTLEGHEGGIADLVYSPQGDRIASGSWDNAVRLWDVESGDCAHTLQGHSEIVTSVVYSPKGNQIASGSYDWTVRLWDVESDNCIHTLQGHSSSVQSVVYSPKGDRIASGSWDSTVRLWDIETGDCIHTLQEHSSRINSVVYSPQGDQIASGSHDKTVRLWDGETGDCIHILQGHRSWVLSVVYSPQGDRIASGSNDSTVRLWDDETGDCIHTLQGHSCSVENVVYSPKGDRIASGSNDSTVRLWDVETGDCIYTLQGHGGYAKNFVYSPKGDQIASMSDDNTVRLLWDVERGNCIHTLQGHSHSVESIVYSPKGDQIASESRGSTVRLWDVESGDCVHTLQGHSYIVTSVVYSLKEDLIASGSCDGTVRLWDVETGDCIRTLLGHSDFVASIVYSPKGDRIASGSDDNRIHLWDVETDDCIHTLLGHSDFVASIVYSPKGDRIASGSHDNTVRLWDAETGNCVHILRGHGDYVESVVYSSKGDQIASGSHDKTARLWDVESGDCIHTLQGHSGQVHSVAYSPKGDQIASGSEDKTVRLWDVQTGECLLLIEGFGGSVTSISWRNAFGHQYLVTGCQDGSVRQWRVIKQGDGFKALLCWSSSHVLTVLHASFNDVQGLGILDRKLLDQRGALCSSSARQD